MSSADLDLIAEGDDWLRRYAEGASVENPATLIAELASYAARVRVQAEAHERALADLVMLVRVGFLVTVNGERGRADVVKEPHRREMLFSILQAKNTAEAVTALAAASPAGGAAAGVEEGDTE